MYVVGSDGFVGTAMRARSRFKDALVGLAPGLPEPSLRIDLRQAEAFDYRQLEAGATVVLMAAISSPDVCSAQPELAEAINVMGTSTFIGRALERGCRVVFFSSDVVFGGCGGPVDESTPKQPLGSYGAMKEAVEARFLGHAGFKVVRPSYIVSISDKFSSYLLGCARGGRTAEVFHPLLRSGIHIDDVVEVVDNLHMNWAGHPAEAINLCGPRLVSRIDLAGMLGRAAGLELDLKVVEPPASFYVSRPPVIKMRSLHLEGLLGRSPLNLEGALKAEILRESNP